MTVFYGLGLHLGNPRSQNARGDLLGQVRDLGLSSGDPNVRIYQTSERQSFHTDSADAVGLLCLKTAKTGGTSLLVSSQTIFNEMRRLRPDLLRLLLEPIATDRRGEVPAGMKPYFLIPVFSYHQDFLTTVYQRQYIDSAQRFEDAPRLTPGHVEALNLFDELANDPRLNFSMQLEPGDMQFVYNHTLLHDRTAFRRLAGGFPKTASAPIMAGSAWGPTVAGDICIAFRQHRSWQSWRRRDELSTALAPMLTRSVSEASLWNPSLTLRAKSPCVIRLH